MDDVIAIDGPTASGKGTAAEIVASRLGFFSLDSGSIYRVVALIWKDGFDLERITWQAGQLYLDGQPVRQEHIRNRHIDTLTPRLAALPEVRSAILPLQRSCAVKPGLTAEGRDMTSVVFPDAALKIFLTSSPEIRARRRLDQYRKKSVPADFQSILAELQERDHRDTSRLDAPLVKVPDAVEINADLLNAEQVAGKIVRLWKRRAKKLAKITDLIR